MNDLVYPRENVYFGICLAISLLIYLVLIVSIVGILYLLLGALVALIAQGLFVGSVRGNGVRVSDTQFPELYAMARDLSLQIGLEQMPSIWVLQAGGMLNAFATRFLGRNFVVVYSDVLELAYSKGEQALAFVLCHELAHIKRRHLARRWLLYPSMMFPFLGTAYSRACEYTCDRFGAHFQPAGAVDGLLVLAAGKTLYGRMNAREFVQQAAQERGFFVWFAEVISTHPNLSKRVRSVVEMTTSAQLRAATASSFSSPM